MKNILTILFSLVLILASCNNGVQEKNEIKQNEKASQLSDNERALELLESKCYVCHSAKIPEKNLLAPPMIAVKERYLEHTENRAEFISKFVSFVTNPSNEKALLKEAVEEYSLMAYQGTSEEDLEKIASYLYEHNIEKPSWWKKDTDLKTKDTSIASIGKNYALSTKKALGKKLMEAIEKGGPAYAVEFCNTRALPITDSVSKHFNASIRRVSDRPRNPKNKANQKELEVIKKYKSQLADGEKLEPLVQEENSKKQFYYPILTSGICLKCHGSTDNDINSETLNKLNTLYPSDEAIGYEENQVRGIWSIIFER